MWNHPSKRIFTHVHAHTHTHILPLGVGQKNGKLELLKNIHVCVCVCVCMCIKCFTNIVNIRMPLSNRAFCDDGNILYQPSLIQYPVGTCDYWVVRYDQCYWITEFLTSHNINLYGLMASGYHIVHHNLRSFLNIIKKLY